MRALWVMASMALLVFSGCVQPTSSPTTPASSASTTPTTPREGHEHVSLRVFNNGTEVRLDDVAYDLSRSQYMRCHIRMGDMHRTILHLEGVLGFPWRVCLEKVGFAFDPAALRLPPQAGGRTIHNNATHEWQLWVDPCVPAAEDWSRAVDWRNYVPLQHDRLLLTYAPKASTAASLASQTATVPTSAHINEVAKDSCPP